VDSAPDFLRKGADDVGLDEGLVRVDLFLEDRRVSGVIEHQGVALRLVDILNSEGSHIVLSDASVPSIEDGGQPLNVRRLHLRRDAILLALPVTQTPPPTSGSVETIEKRPAAATIILPGIEITGHVHLPPEADPATVRILSRLDFMPVTEAEITQPARGLFRWARPLVIVNLARAFVYAPA
jgi:hypothetical protein